MTAARTAPTRHPALFLVLLPLFFIAHGVIENYPIILVKDVIGLLPLYWFAAGIITVLAWLYYRDWVKAALFAFALLCVHFFYGSLHDLLKRFFGQGVPGRYSFLLPALALLLLALFFFLKKTKTRLTPLVFFINLLLLLSIAADAGQWIVSHRNKRQSPVIAQLPGLDSCAACERPDIYLVIADGYAGEGELSSYLHYDNSPFIAALRQRGFFVVDSSRSNYNYTPFSMASMLNFDYVANVNGRYTLETEKNICYPLIGQNRFWRYLRDRQGYSLRNFSLFPIDGLRPPVYSPFFRSGREIITAQTIVSRFNRDVRFNFVTQMKWRSELKRYARYEVRAGNLDVLQRTLAESRLRVATPRFIYAHLEMPHYPYFYRKDGSENPVEALTDYQRTQPGLYVEYLQYCNARLLELVDGIRRNSARPPVILLMSDHGFRALVQDIPADAQQLNLNAVLLPSNDYKGWYPGISNVNHLRVFVNTQFHQQLPLLRDSISYLLE